MSDLRMWSYWRDKNGHEDALTDYFPEVVAANPDLQQALYSIRAAKALIDQTMTRLEAEAND